MKKTLLILALAVITAFALFGCSAEKKAARKAVQYEQYAAFIEVKNPKQQFFDLTKGLVVNVITTQPKEQISENYFHYSGHSQFKSSIPKYARALGFQEMNAKTDMILDVKINRADMAYGGGVSYMDLDIDLKDPNGIIEFSQKGISTNSSLGGVWGLVDAYAKSLKQINWNRIASYLRTEQLPKDEPQKQVQGYGDTALEQTIIRWDIQSRPQGADIFWRVVSKTPEVKSTNNKYLMTTPYEATKALDIKGLTYQTSSNVRIILRCEKDGYMSQEKEFDVRMVLDQEEISAFFRLVKEE